MLNLQDKKRSEYSPDDLRRLEASLEDYWDRSRDLETASIADLEKHLWLGNGGAVTASIALFQKSGWVSSLQYVGAWSFVVGLLCLVILKFISTVMTSRDRARFQEAKSRFDAGECTDLDLRPKALRDETTQRLIWTYRLLQYGAGLAFVAGLLLTLFGFACVV